MYGAVECGSRVLLHGVYHNGVHAMRRNDVLLCAGLRTLLQCLPVCSYTRCLHFTAGCTTGWVNYANEPSQAALERSSQDAYDSVRLTRSKAAVWTVDDVVTRLIEILLKRILIFVYSFFYPR